MGKARGFRELNHVLAPNNHQFEPRNSQIDFISGALRMPDTSEVARDFSLAWSLLLLRFVVYEDSNLRLAGSDSYLAEVFPRYQCRHNDG